MAMPTSRACLLRIPSANGLRQMFPRQTKRMRVIDIGYQPFDADTAAGGTGS